jgi:cation diffusion facilitator family transporter
MTRLHGASATIDCRAPHEIDHRFGQGARTARERRVLAAVVLTLVIMTAEIVVGWWSGSIALLADGVHMGTHALALGIALAGYVIARRYSADRRFSFGTGKVQELAGFASAVLLGVTAVAIAVQSIERLLAPQTIRYTEALIAAVIGLVANLVSYAILRGAGASGGHSHRHDHEHGHHDHEDSNLRGALLHVLADALTSVGAIGALLAGLYLGWSWLDPVVAIAAAIVIAVWSVGLVRATASVLLDREAPTALRDAVARELESDGDTRVLDLHVWSVGPGVTTAVASVVTHGTREPADYKAGLEEELGIMHPIVEVQRCRAHDAVESAAEIRQTHDHP